ncbi:MAG: hypothetical protein U0990_05500 [Candidatus Nanopelagicales bacterium]|nr:hypothetical protein [Candidatus Nanopelagicales bacterium]
MTMPAVESQAYLDLDADEMIKMLEQLVGWGKSYMHDITESMFPDGRLPLTRDTKGATAELESFLERTYPQDYGYLEDLDYIDKYRKGEYPPLQSPYWLAMMAVPEFFKREQRRFRDLYRDKILKPAGAYTPQRHPDGHRGRQESRQPVRGGGY